MSSIECVMLDVSAVARRALPWTWLCMTSRTSSHPSNLQDWALLGTNGLRASFWVLGGGLEGTRWVGSVGDAVEVVTRQLELLGLAGPAGSLSHDGRRFPPCAVRARAAAI